MKKTHCLARLAASLILFALLCGCVAMRPADQAALRELEEYGISKEDQAIKNPGLAGALNILPGFGNFYLAIGTEESSQWAIGFLNLLAWPVSVVWGIPEAAIDASTINKKETLYYYQHTDKGRAVLEAKKRKYAQSLNQ